MIETRRKKGDVGINDLRELDQLEDRSAQNEGSANKPLTFSARTLDAVVAESIDSVLNQLLAKKATEAIYDYLERHYSFAREDIAQDTDKLFAVLERLFGEKGRGVASRCIAKRMFENLDLEFTPVAGLEFSGYVEMARTRIATKLTEKRM
ncbi:MAG: hypothetical protein ABSF63_11150 [Candidatus Bathyarchaeia archaeon]